MAVASSSERVMRPGLAVHLATWAMRSPPRWCIGEAVAYHHAQTS